MSGRAICLEHLVCAVFLAWLYNHDLEHVSPEDDRRLAGLALDLNFHSG